MAKGKGKNVGAKSKAASKSERQAAEKAYAGAAQMSRGEDTLLAASKLNQGSKRAAAEGASRADHAYRADGDVHLRQHAGTG